MENQGWTFLIPSRAILLAGKAGIGEKGWFRQLEKAGGQNVHEEGGHIKCLMPENELEKASREIAEFAQRSHFPNATMVDAGNERRMTLSLGEPDFKS